MLLLSKFYLPFPDNSFQAEEPVYNSRFKNIRKSTQYSTSVPITMPLGKNSPSQDNEVIIIKFMCHALVVRTTPDKKIKTLRCGGRGAWASSVKASVLWIFV